MLDQTQDWINHMARETDQEFSARRYNEEKLLARNAEDSGGAISHRKLAKHHENKAAEDNDAAFLETEAMPVAVVEGHVEITAPGGEVTALTPGAAFATADGLMARAHKAEKPQ
jgi:uncharacterized cupin superfamily protein